MGITGLLKGLQFCSQKRHIRDFSNQVLAVDLSSWLHKSVYSISERYVESLDSGRLDTACVEVATKYIVVRCQELLLHANIAHIYLVLDGKRCPLKSQTNKDREERRQKNLADARRYKQAGRPDKAQEKYKACIKITSDMANAVSRAVTRSFANDRRVECIYSPYEADAQLVKLCMDRIAHAVVTEDSDVLVYSASCNFSFPILYKLERDTGACDVITMDWLLNPDVQPNWTQPNGTKQKSGIALESILKSLLVQQSKHPGAGARLFVQACVLAGCDYCPSQLNGVGLVNAFKLVRDNAHRPAAGLFCKALKSLSKKARSNIEVAKYEELLSKSEAVFYYHPVLDVNTKRVIPLLKPREDEEGNQVELLLVSDHHPSLNRFGRDWSFLGSMMSSTHDSSQANLKRGDDAAVDKAPLSEIIVNHAKVHRQKQKKSSVAPAVYDRGDAAVTAITRNIVANPYAKAKKRKRSDGDGEHDLVSTMDSISQSNGANNFSKYAYKKTVKNSQIKQPRATQTSLSMYMNKGADPRFVKRDFRGKSRPYAKMLSEVNSQGKSHRSGHSTSNGHTLTRQGVESSNLSVLPATGGLHAADSFLRNSYEVGDSGQEFYSSHQQAMQANSEQEEHSFCYSEAGSTAGPRTVMNIFQEPIDESISQHHMQQHEDCDPEAVYQSNTSIGYDAAGMKKLPFGNPDYKDAFGPSTSSYFSTNQQSSRRVTLEYADEAAATVDHSDLRYDHVGEYHTHVDNLTEGAGRPLNGLSDTGSSQAPFDGASKPPARRMTLEDATPSSYNEFDAPHITCNGSCHNAPDSGMIAVSTLMLQESRPSFSHANNISCFGNANDCLSVSSCEDIASPDHQDKTRQRFNDYSWADGCLQEDQIKETPRERKLAPIFRQTPQNATFATGTTPAQPLSPLSVTSPPRNASILNIQTMPGFSRSRGNSKGATISNNGGAITDFFPVKISLPTDENDFARF